MEASSFDLIKRALTMDFDRLTVKKATTVFFSIRILDIHSVTKTIYDRLMLGYY